MSSQPLESPQFFPWHWLGEQGVEQSQVTSVTPVSGGYSGAGVWRIETKSPIHEFALRQWPRDGLPVERLRGLHRFQRYLSEQGIEPLPIPLQRGGSDSLVNHKQSWWQIEPWMPGTADFEQNPSQERLAAVMTTLARIHLCSAQYGASGFGTSAADREWFSTETNALPSSIETRRELLEFWSSNRLSDTRARLQRMPETEFRRFGERVIPLAVLLVSWCRTCWDRLQSVRVPVFPCLRDLRVEHVLFQGECLTGIVDWGACRSDTVVADLTRFLGGAVADDHQHWSDALRAYTTVRPLSEVEQTLIPFYDHSQVVLSCLNWLKWIVFDGRPVPTNAHFSAHMSRLLLRLEALFGTVG